MLVPIALLILMAPSGILAQYRGERGFPIARHGPPAFAADLSIEQADEGLGRFGGTPLGSGRGAAAFILASVAVGEEADFLHDNTDGSFAVWVIAGTTVRSALGADLADRDGGNYVLPATPLVQALVVGTPLIGN